MDVIAIVESRTSSKLLLRLLETVRRMSPKKQRDSELLCSHLLCRWHLLIRIVPENLRRERVEVGGRCAAAWRKRKMLS